MHSGACSSPKSDETLTMRHSGLRFCAGVLMAIAFMNSQPVMLVRGADDDVPLAVVSNRNKNSPGVLPSNYHGDVLFPNDYDWDEYDRAVDELGSLGDRIDERMLELLISNSEDETFLVAMSSNGGSARAYTRGRVFELIAWHSLASPVSSLTGGGERIRSQLRNRLLHTSSAAPISLKAWRSQRMKLSLCEIQAEIVENAVALLEPAQKDGGAAVSQLKRKAVELRRTSTVEVAHGFFDIYDVVTKEHALKIKRKFFLQELREPEFLVERVPLSLFKQPGLSD